MPPFRLVDAFSATAFAGNPAGVVLLDAPESVGWMRAIAAEVNVSETAFLAPDPAAGDTWKLRWFTPTTEVDLCGHATLASAHVLWQDGLAAENVTLRFHTRSGELAATFAGGTILLDLPAWPVRPHPEPARLVAALQGVGGHYLGRTAGSAGEENTGGEQANDVVMLRDEAAVRDLVPDLDEIAALGASGLIVTARADQDGDFVSRYFAPVLGVPEDPVTGSAHATLGPLWAAALGRDELLARQLSRRGGRLQIRVVGDRVLVGGEAVTVVRGEVLG